MRFQLIQRCCKGVLYLLRIYLGRIDHWQTRTMSRCGFCAPALEHPILDPMVDRAFSVNSDSKMATGFRVNELE